MKKALRTANGKGTKAGRKQARGSGTPPGGSRHGKEIRHPEWREGMACQQCRGGWRACDRAGAVLGSMVGRERGNGGESCAGARAG